MGLTKLMKNKGFKKLISRLYGFGASIAILGALFKIQHWTGAGFMLAAGLITEAVIFIFYAFDTEDEPEPSSSANNNYLISNDQFMGNYVNSGASVALAKFDELLVKSEISPDVLQTLGTGMKRLGETTANLNTLGDVSAASKSYVSTIKAADESLERLAKTYQTTIIKVINRTEFNYKSIADSLSSIEPGVKSYRKNIETLNDNLDSLNKMFSRHKLTSDSLMNELSDSAIETKKFNDQIKSLNRTMAELNLQYSKMLNAVKE